MPSKTLVLSAQTSLLKENESLDIERFSDTLKPKKKKSHERLLGGSQSYSYLHKLEALKKLEAKLKAEGKEEMKKEKMMMMKLRIVVSIVIWIPLLD